MKTIPIAAHYALPQTSLCTCLLVTRRDGVAFGVTSLGQALTVGAVTYRPGFDPGAIVSTAGLAPDTLDLTILPDDDDILEADLLSGLWDNCAFEIFEVNFRAPGAGVNVLKTGTGGEAQVGQGRYTIELRSLKQALQQPVGQTTQRQCRANFADYPRQALGARCGLSPSDWTVVGTITGVTSQQIAEDSARAEADDHFGEGFLRFTSGLNAGYERQVQAFEAGEFTFRLPFPFEIQTGDDYSAIAGCRKRHERGSEADDSDAVSDCADRFDNILNFQGEPHMPGIDAITKVPGVGGE